MKVVLFCGGMGTRMKEYSDTIPKPMIEIGYRPIIWHLMRYYAHFGHKEFILCLGYRGDLIKKYFLDYDEYMFNDFVLTPAGRRLYSRSTDIHDWDISFVDTGQHANIGQRLLAVKQYLKDDDVFMANYCDGLADLNLDKYLAQFCRSRKVAGFLCVKPSQTFHIVHLDANGQVRGLVPACDSGVWINGGFFVFRREIFHYIQKGEELVEEPFYRLISHNELFAYRNSGFWACMDTLKEKKMFDDMFAKGDMPWTVWGPRSDNVGSDSASPDNDGAAGELAPDEAWPVSSKT